LRRPAFILDENSETCFDPNVKKEESLCVKSKRLRLSLALSMLSILAIPISGCHTADPQPPADTTNRPTATPAQVYRISTDGSLTPYDSSLLTIIERHWFELLEAAPSPLPKSGEVVVDFRLHTDGRVSDLEITRNTAGTFASVLSQKAIRDPAPFKPMPPELLSLLTNDYRNLSFTFNYGQ
jgi:hypothetical protein